MTSLLAPETKANVAQSIKRLEQATAAELVVTVRAQSDSYREVDLSVGAAAGFAAVLVYVFAPITFYDDLAPPAVLFCFLAAALASARVKAHKRYLVGAARRRARVQQAARAAFFDQRIASTTARTGILVFVSLLERRVEVLLDSGLDVSVERDAWLAALESCEAAVASRSADGFLRALDAMGEVLAKVCPPAEHDKNELTDEVA